MREPQNYDKAKTPRAAVKNSVLGIFVLHYLAIYGCNKLCNQQIDVFYSITNFLKKYPSYKEKIQTPSLLGRSSDNSLLVDDIGLEPMTFRTSSGCSSQLS